MSQAELTTDFHIRSGLEGEKRRARRRALNVLLPLLPASLFFAIFLIAPLGVVGYYSLQPGVLTSDAESLSLANYAYYLARPHYVAVITRTLEFALATTVISVLVGYGASLVLRKVSETIGSTAILILAFPILAGPIVTVMGWMIMFTSGGVVGRSIAFVRSILGMPEVSTRLIGSDIAVITGMIHFNLAFVILNLLNVMLKIDPTLEEAAMNLGANRWQVFRQVILPLSMPGLLSASLISFALAMNAFVTPIYLGNPSRLVLTTQIAQFMRTAYNWQMASATSVILLWISLAIILVYNHIVSRTIRT